MQAASRRNLTSRRDQRGFTYIEMLTVLVVIGILMAIVLRLGGSVSENGRARQTQATIATLDSALTSYLTERPGQFPADFRDSAGVQFPIIDGRCTEDIGGPPNSFTAPAFPSLALFFASVRGNEAIESVVRGLDPSRVVQVQMSQYSSRFPQPQERRAGASADTAIRMITVLDGWDRPIRFVHPKYDGGFGNGFRQASPGAAAFSSVGRENLELDLTVAGGGTQRATFRRAAMPFDPSGAGYQTAWTGDADEGLSPGERPYFYSSGRDGNPGTRQDNIYSTRPNFPAETATSAQ